MNIAGVVKDWMLIGLSVWMFKSAVSGLNLFGCGESGGACLLAPLRHACFLKRACKCGLWLGRRAWVAMAARLRSRSARTPLSLQPHLWLGLTCCACPPPLLCLCSYFIAFLAVCW